MNFIKENILIIVVVLSIVLVGTAIFGVDFIKNQRHISPLEQRKVTRTCDFLEINEDTFIFCVDGSEWRVIDSFEPEGK